MALANTSWSPVELPASWALTHKRSLSTRRSGSVTTAHLNKLIAVTHHGNRWLARTRCNSLQQGLPDNSLTDAMPSHQTLDEMRRKQPVKIIAGHGNSSEKACLKVSTVLPGYPASLSQCTWELAKSWQRAGMHSLVALRLPAAVAVSTCWLCTCGSLAACIIP